MASRHWSIEHAFKVAKPGNGAGRLRGAQRRRLVPARDAGAWALAGRDAGRGPDTARPSKESEVPAWPRDRRKAARPEDEPAGDPAPAVASGAAVLAQSHWHRYHQWVA